MAEKTTRKKSKATRKKSARKTAKRSAKSADETTETAVETTEAAAPVAAAEPPDAAPARKAARKSARKTAPKGQRKSARKPAERPSEPSAEPEPTEVEAAADTEQTSAAPRQLEENGAIVIEFPPVAPPPFTGVPARPEPRREEHPPRAEPQPEARPARVERPAARRAEPDSAPPMKPAARAERPEPAARPAEPPHPEERGRDRKPRAERAHREEELAESSLQGMTRSQKRRLRRRRVRQQRGKDDVADTGPETAVAVSPDDTEDRAQAIAEQIEAAEDAETDLLEFEDVEALDAPEEVLDISEAEEEVDAAEPRKRRRRRRGRGRRGVPEEAAEVREQPEAAEVERTAPAPRREMIINAVPREECRIAILNDGMLEEIYFERATAESHVGNIYKGIVTNVEPSIQAAFIDYGLGKNGFLHISDLHPQYFPNGQSQTENVGHKMPRRHRPPIQRCLRRGQEVLVQVTKEGIGTKGPTLTTYLSIPGRFLVMMPGMRRLGVSRRIEDDESRDTLRKLLNELELPEGMGFIARTAALDRTRKELQSDLSYLSRLWRAVDKRIKHDPAPAELYRESDLVIRTIRDVFTSDVGRIVVDDPDVADRAREFLSIFSPRSEDIVALYTEAVPIFHKYGIEAELERLHSRHVPLKSGGSLVIDQTEALVAIDVNSGRFRTEDDAETTAFKINVEAADEIPRQLRLRDLGGVVVCDFIDMRLEKHRREIERRMIRNLKEHKERAKVLRMSAFGMIELTRQRQRASLTRSIYQDCRHCRGTGLVKTIESVALDVMRLVQLAVSREHIQMIEVSISPDVAYVLQNRKRRLIADLERDYRRTIFIRPEPNFSLDQVEIRCTDARGRVVPNT